VPNASRLASGRSHAQEREYARSANAMAAPSSETTVEAGTRRRERKPCTTGLGARVTGGRTSLAAPALLVKSGYDLVDEKTRDARTRVAETLQSAADTLQAPRKSPGTEDLVGGERRVI
jgi:hypothetical protein